MRLTKITLFIFFIFNALIALLSSCQEDTIDRKDNLAAAQNLVDQSSSESETDVNVISNNSSESSETLGLGLAPTLSLTGTVTPTGASVYKTPQGVVIDSAFYSLAKNGSFTIIADGIDFAQQIKDYFTKSFSATMASTTISNATHGDYFNRYPHSYSNWIGTGTSTGVGTTTTLAANNPCQELQGGNGNSQQWDYYYELPHPPNPIPAPNFRLWPGDDFFNGNRWNNQNGTIAADFFSCQYTFSQGQTSSQYGSWEKSLFPTFVQNVIRSLCGNGASACTSFTSLTLAPLYLSPSNPDSGHWNRIWFSWPSSLTGSSCYWDNYYDGGGNTQTVLQTDGTCKLPIEYLGVGTDANKRATNLYNAVSVFLNLINARTVEYSGTAMYRFLTSNFVMPMSTLIGQYTGSDFPKKLFVLNSGSNGMLPIALTGKALLFQHEHLFEQKNTTLTQQMIYPGSNPQVSAKTLFQRVTLKDLAGAAPCFFYNGECGNVTALFPPSNYHDGTIAAPNLFMILWNPPSNPGTQSAWLQYNAIPQAYPFDGGRTFTSSDSNLFYRIYRDSNGYYIFTDPSGQNCLYASQSTNPNANRFLLTEPCNPTNNAERFH